MTAYENGKTENPSNENTEARNTYTAAHAKRNRTIAKRMSSIAILSSVLCIARIVTPFG